MARGLAEIAAAHNLSELIVDTKETTLTIRRGGGAMTMAMPMPQMMQMPQMSGMPQMHAPVAHAPAPAAAPAAAPAVDDKSHVVTSPFVGTFYRKPNPDSPNYVTMGEKVDKGRVLCIVEAMKLMNEIESDVSGTIVRVLPQNAEQVEFGAPLFLIRPA
ncbi:MAG TPA: acetyl-CoA carboxylase biotin carboxyl carrier protein, partial [Kofleriaceae bacterium]